MDQPTIQPTRYIAAAAALLCMLLTILSGCGGSSVLSMSNSFTDSITDDDWANTPISDLIQRSREQPPFHVALQSESSELSPDELTIVGSAHFYGQGARLDQGLGTALIQQACDRGQLRACVHLGLHLVDAPDPFSHAKGVDYLQRACSDGIAWGCVGLVIAHGEGRGVERNIDTAIEFAELSCQKKNSRPCVNAGSHLLGFAPEASQRLLTAACEARSAIGCNFLGEYYHNGKFGAVDHELAKSAYLVSCEGYLPASCHSLLYYAQGPEVDVPEIEAVIQNVAWFCDQGLGESCVRLANIFKHPLESGLEQDDRAFIAFSKAACDLEEVQACEWLAYAYDNGSSVAKDKAKAVEVYKWLCGNGKSIYCINVAEYEAVQAEASGTADRAAIISRACDLGDGEACRSLAWSYASGKHTEQDVDRAAVLFEIGCAHGAAASCVDLGSLYDWSLHGMTEDKAYAQEMYKRACDMGFVIGCDLVK